MTVESLGSKLLGRLKTTASRIFPVLAILEILLVVNCSAVEPPPRIAHDISRKISLGGHGLMMNKASVSKFDIARIRVYALQCPYLFFEPFYISNL